MRNKISSLFIQCSNKYRREDIFMDYKAVKQPVCVNETVFEKSCEVPFDIEFTMPDYCPDIMKILKCRVYPRIASKTINGNNVSIDGSVMVNVMYSDQSGCIYNYEQISPFSKTLEPNIIFLLWS